MIKLSGVYTKVAAFLDFIENPETYSTAASIYTSKTIVSLSIFLGMIVIKS